MTAAFFRTAAATAAAIAALAGQAAAATPQEASRFIAGLSFEALAATSSDAPLPSREAELRKLLQRGLDLDFMSRFVVGPYWREANPEQRAEYRQLFDEFVLRTYAHRLAGQQIKNFKVAASREAGSGEALVTEEVQPADGRPVIYEFRVHGDPPQESIIDVSVDGLSMLIGQRSDFTTVVQKSGFAGLIAALRRKLAAK